MQSTYWTANLKANGELTRAVEVRGVQHVVGLANVAQTSTVSSAGNTVSSTRWHTHTHTHALEKHVQNTTNNYRIVTTTW